MGSGDHALLTGPASLVPPPVVWSATAPSAPADWFSPLQVMRRVWSRRLMLLGVAGIVLTALIFILFILTPLYTGSTQLVLESSSNQPSNPLQAPPPVVVDRETVVSEIQVILSRTIADRAIRDLRLDTRPEFNPTLRTGVWSRVTSIFGSTSSRAAIIEQFYKHLQVYQVGTSRVIAVEFTSSDPVLARDGANRVADLYLQDQRQTRLDATAQTRDWLGQQIDTLRQRVADSESKAEAFRARTGLLEGSGVQLQSQQLTELNTQLSTARAARVEAQARVAGLQRVAGGANQGDSETQVLQSPLIQQLRAQEVQLKREVTEMQAQLLPSHPRMLQKQAELNNLEQQVRAEVGKVIQSVRTEADVAGARETSVQRELSRLESRRTVANRDEIQLRALEREATANRGVLESFLSRYTEMSTRNDLSMQDSNARIISRADTPETPSFPQKSPMLVLALMVAFASGLSAVFVAELTNRKVRYANDIENTSGVPVLAALPSVSMPHDETIRSPDGRFAEGIRSLHQGLGVTPAGLQRGRIIVVTSTARGEGRTTTAISLARLMSRDGLRVLLIDGDFQQPDLVPMMGLRLAWGFTDMISGRAGFKHVVARDPASNAHVMTSGRSNPMAALASPRLPPIMTALARAYDVVVFDAPPVWSVEAHLLARMADQCVYAVRYDSTERDKAAAGVRRLSASGVRGGIGVVLTFAKNSALFR